MNENNKILFLQLIQNHLHLMRSITRAVQQIVQFIVVESVVH